MENVNVIENNTELAALKAELEAMKAVNAKLKAEKKAKIAARKLGFKVGDKGGVSVYGLSSRFPVTLYKSQWEKLLSASEDIKAFMKANDHLLVNKED